MQADLLFNRLTQCSIPVDESRCALLCRYHELLTDWNTRMDLTNITDPAEALDRHYTDSLIALTQAQLFPQGASLIDVGTGAGFPGLPLAIVRPDLKVTLVDALNKRITFLNAVIEDLKLPNVRAIHARAEDAARQPQLREAFDIAAARAVAATPVLLEYLLPFVKVGGNALMWKGPSATEELPQAQKAAQLLGGALQAPLPLPIPGLDWQHLLIPCKKVSKTLRQYPRKAGTPVKKPLGEPT